MPSDLKQFASLFASPAPAVLQTHRKDGSTKLSPVWFRHEVDHFEVVIADDDIKLKHIRRDQTVTLLIFEAVPPFRGVQVTGKASIGPEGLDETRRAITSRYLSDEASKEFTERRRGNGVVVRIPSSGARTWDLSAIT